MKENTCLRLQPENSARMRVYSKENEISHNEAYDLAAAEFLVKHRAREIEKILPRKSKNETVFLRLDSDIKARMVVYAMKHGAGSNYGRAYDLASEEFLARHKKEEN